MTIRWVDFLGAAILGLMLVMLGPVQSSARERADAPNLKLLGFSENGRYFAFEQYGDHGGLDEAHFTIDVIDRETGSSADGFPFGLLGVQKNGEFPLKVGQHEIKADESLPAEKQLADLRRRVRAAGRPRLDALGITDGFQRLAGDPITAKGPSRPAVDFTLHGTLPGPLPDIDRVYRLSARIIPNDQAICARDERPQDHRIELTLRELIPGKGKVAPASRADIAWPHGDHECASSAIITDVVAAEGGGGRSHIVAVVLATSWGSHAESARYFASFIRLPNSR